MVWPRPSFWLGNWESPAGPFYGLKAGIFNESILRADYQEHCSTLPLKALLKNRLLPSLLRTLFPIMAAEPPLGQLDPEDQDSEEEELEIGLLGETPKHFAVQVRCGTRAGQGVRWLWEDGRQRWSPAKSPCHFSGRGHAGTTFAT